MPQDPQQFRFSVTGPLGEKTVTVSWDRFNRWVQNTGSEDPQKILGSLPSGLVTELYRKSQTPTVPGSGLPVISALSTLPVGATKEQYEMAGVGTNIPARLEQQQADRPPSDEMTLAQAREAMGKGGGAETDPTLLSTLLDVPYGALYGSGQTGVPFLELALPVDHAFPPRPYAVEGGAKIRDVIRGGDDSNILRRGAGSLFGFTAPAQLEGELQFFEALREGDWGRVVTSVPQALVPLIGQYGSTALENMRQAGSTFQFFQGLGQGAGLLPGTALRLGKGAAKGAATAAWSIPGRLPGPVADVLESTPGWARTAASAAGRGTAKAFEDLALGGGIPGSRALGRMWRGKNVEEAKRAQLGEAVGIKMPSMGMVAKFSRGIAPKVFTTSNRWKKYAAELENKVTGKLESVLHRGLSGDYLPDHVYGNQLSKAIDEMLQTTQASYRSIYDELYDALHGSEVIKFDAPKVMGKVQDYLKEYKWSSIDALDGVDDLHGSFVALVKRYAGPGRGGRRVPGLEVDPHVVTRPARGRDPRGRTVAEKPLPGEEFVPAAKMDEGQLRPTHPLTGRPTAAGEALGRPDLLESTVPRAPGGSIPTAGRVAGGGRVSEAGMFEPAELTHAMQLMQDRRVISRLLRSLENKLPAREAQLAQDMLEAIDLDIYRGLKIVEERMPTPRFKTEAGEIGVAELFENVQTSYAKMIKQQGNGLVKLFKKAEEREFLPGLIFGTGGEAKVSFNHLLELKEWLPDGEFETLGRRALIGKLKNIMGEAADPTSYGNIEIPVERAIAEGFALKGHQMFEWFSRKRNRDIVESILGPEQTKNLDDVLTVANRVSMNVGGPGQQAGLFSGMLNIAIAYGPSGMLGYSLSGPGMMASAGGAAVGAFLGGEFFLLAATSALHKPQLIGYLSALENGKPQQAGLYLQHLMVSLMESKDEVLKADSELEARKEQEERESGVVGSRSFDPSLDSERESRSRRGGIDPRMLATGLGARLPGTQNWSGRRQ